MMLGNYSVEQMEDRLGIEFPKECREFMLGTRQVKATDIEVGKWHCFDIPFQLVCGDEATARKIGEWLSPLSSQMKTAISIAWIK